MTLEEEDDVIKSEVIGNEQIRKWESEIFWKERHQIMSLKQGSGNLEKWMRYTNHIFGCFLPFYTSLYITELYIIYNKESI